MLQELPSTTQDFGQLPSELRLGSTAYSQDNLLEAMRQSTQTCSDGELKLHGGS